MAEPAGEFAAYIRDRISAVLKRQGTEARVLGPPPAPIAKLRNQHRFHMILQSADRDGLRSAVREATTDLQPPGDVQWIVDVDPIDML